MPVEHLVLLPMLVGGNAVSISYGILQQKSCHAARVKQAGQDMNTVHSTMQVEETISQDMAVPFVRSNLTAKCK